MGEVNLDIEDGVATVTLNAPERRNAMTLAMVAEVVGAFDELEADPAVGAVIVTGAGRGFCAGADLAALVDASDGGVARIYDGFLRVARCPLPTIAAVNGAAVGAGLNLALVCDIRIVSTDALFIARFLELGLHPGGGNTWMMRNLLGPQAAAAMLLFGESLDGRGALERGLAWSCVEPEVLMTEATRLARAAANAPRPVAEAVKSSLSNAPTITDHDSAVEAELDIQLWTLRQPWFRQRLAAMRSGRRRGS